MQPVTRVGTRQQVPAIPAIELIVGLGMVLAVIASRTTTAGPNVFLGIADKVASGLVPYRDFVLEYPPLALFPVALPRLIGGPSDAAYDRLFIVMAVAATIATAAAVAWLAERGWSSLSRNGSLLAFGAMVLAAVPQVIWRFDIFPALFSALALVAVASRRPGWAGLSLALGAAVKLYPAFLLPVLLAYYLFGRRWRSAAMLVFGFGALLAALGALLYAVAGPDGFTFLTYQKDRGVEVESVMAGLVLAGNNLFGTPFNVVHDFGAFQVESPLIATLAPANVIAMLFLGALLAVSLFLSFQRDARRHGNVQPRTLVAFLLATLLLMMLANKVLSPQYVAWLLPFGALLPWRKSALLVVICALTTLEFPIAFDALLDAWPSAVLILNLRNLLLLVLFLWLLVPRREAAPNVRALRYSTGRQADRQRLRTSEGPWPGAAAVERSEPSATQRR